MSRELETKCHRLAEMYIELLNNPASTSEDLKSFLHAEITWQEMPNRFAPTGRTNGFNEILATWEKGREFLPQQKYIVRRLIVSGDTVVLEFAWQGIIAKPLTGLPAGTKLSAQIVSILQFLDGKIVSQTDYPCYDPLISGAA